MSWPDSGQHWLRFNLEKPAREIVPGARFCSTTSIVRGMTLLAKNI